MVSDKIRPTTHVMHDPFTNKSYDYSTQGNPQAERLMSALELALNDQCPPDRKDYLCEASEDEDTSSETCEKCIMRWATAQFGKYRK